MNGKIHVIGGRGPDGIVVAAARIATCREVAATTFGERDLQAGNRIASPRLPSLLDHLVRDGRCRGLRFPFPLTANEPPGLGQITGQIEQPLVDGCQESRKGSADVE